MSVPAHKVVGDKDKPGQWVNPDITLGDYLARKRRYDALDTVALEKVNTVKKLTFDEWYVSIRPKNGGMPYDDWFVCMQAAWKAAQENV